MGIESPPEHSRTRNAAEGLREQAASWRRFAACARTPIGTTSMNALADRFDEQAHQLDPASERQ